MTFLLVGVIIYVVLQIAIGIWVSRKVATTGDFIVAGRSLGVPLLMFSVFASFFGAEAIVGTGGAVYESGLSGAEADPFAYGVAIVVVGSVFAAALWRRGFYTLADLFRARFSPGVEALVVIALIPGSMFWAAAQIRAFGQVVGSASGLSLEVAILAGAAVVVCYGVLGGMLADAWTDLLQGVVIVVGLVVLAILVATNSGGAVGGLGSVEAEKLTWTPGADGWLTFLETWAVPICGTIVAVEIISRVLSARSAGTATVGTVSGGVLYVAVGLLPVYIALVGASQVPGLADGEQVIPKLAELHLPPLLLILFVGALVSAILSTVDTVLLASSAQLSRNLLFRFLPELGPRRELAFTRLTLVALAVVAVVLALTAEGVKDLISTASAAASSGVVIATVFGLFTAFGGPLAATASIVVGSGCWLAFGLSEAVEAPFVLSVGAALAAYVAAALFEKANKTS